MQLDDPKEQLKRIHINSYELTYVDDFLKAFKSRITEQIITDFENIYKINSDYDIFQYSEITLKNISFKQDKLTFNTTLDNFSKMVFSVINAYGMFEYDSLDQFYYCNSANTDIEKIKTITGHLHWLNRFEEIYSSIYYIFKDFDISKLDPYGTFGSIILDSFQDIDNYIADYGIE